MWNVLSDFYIFLLRSVHRAGVHPFLQLSAPFPGQVPTQVAQHAIGATPIGTAMESSSPACVEQSLLSRTQPQDVFQS